MSDGVVEVETSVGRTFEPQQSRDPLQKDATLGEQMIEARSEAVADSDDGSPVAPTLEPETVRAWAALAQQEVAPEFDDREVQEHLRDYYVGLRDSGDGADSPIPMTARNLEAMLRLAEASARVRLSDTVTMADAERAISLVERSMRDVGLDPETGTFDVDIIETGSSQTQRNRKKAIRELIKELDEETDGIVGARKEDVLEAAVDQGYDHSQVEHDIDSFKEQGDVYEPSSSTIRWT